MKILYWKNYSIFFYVLLFVFQSTHIHSQEKNNVCALVLTIDSEKQNMSKDYILAGPRLLAIGKNDDILVCDEMKIKIFTNTGMPKAIIGGYGQGPGEFLQSPLTYIGPLGYIAAKELNYVTIFSSNYKIVKKINMSTHKLLNDYFETKGFKYPSIEEYIPKNEFETIYSVKLQKDNKEIKEIIYEKPNEITSIMKVEVPDKSYKGDLFFGMLDTNRVLYHNAFEDVFNVSGKYYYTVQIICLDNNTYKKYTRSFTPVLISIDEELEVLEKMKEKSQNKLITDKMIKERKEKIEAQKYYHPILYLWVDMQYVYFWLDLIKKDGKITSASSKNPGELTQFCIDIFDVNSERFLEPIQLQFLPVMIKNGYVYNIDKNQDGYPVINKYKINPAVYGK